MEPAAPKAAYSAPSMGFTATTATSGGGTALVSALVVGSRPGGIDPGWGHRGVWRQRI
jgi:hypothetical protein